MKTARFAWALLAGLTGGSAQTYTLTDLGALPGLDFSTAMAINASGQVAGFAMSADFTRMRGFLYSGGKLIDLGALPSGAFSLAAGINASAQVVGVAEVNQSTHAFRYSGGQLTDLGTLGGDTSSAAAISDSGQVVGHSNLRAKGDAHAFVYANGQMADLGTLGGSYSAARSINAAGQIVGLAETAFEFNPEHAFLHAAGLMTDLGTLGGGVSWANCINAGGQVVGGSYLSSAGSPVPLYGSHAFLYANGKMTDLGTLPSFDSSEPRGINASGQIVGESYDSFEGDSFLNAYSSGMRAFVYQGGHMSDLNGLVVGSPGWTLLSAVAINDRGQIAGLGRTPTGQVHAFLLDPSGAPVLPRLIEQPASQSVVLGARAAFSVSAVGTGFSYQWMKNGNPIPGATAAAYAIATVTPGDMGFYSVVVSGSGGATESTVAILTLAAQSSNPSRLLNLSARGFLPAQGNLTVGFVIRGDAVKPLLVRGVGPTLGSFGVDRALADPRLDVFPAGVSAARNSCDDWGGGVALADAFAGVGAFALAAGSKDAAVLVALSSGGYTARITSAVSSEVGVALAEIYDRDVAAGANRLINVSTLGLAGLGTQALTAGFVIDGAAAKQLLIRVVGPGLAPFGVANRLSDPRLSITPLGKSFTVGANDNWDGAAATVAAFVQAGAFALEAGSKDAALVVRLPPGGYTVIVSGVGDATGTALVEVYDLDP